MKKLIFPLVTAVIVITVGLGTYFISKQTQSATKAAIEFIDDLNKSHFSGETAIEYDKISTSALSQSTTITDLSLDLNDIGSITIDSVEVSRNFWNTDKAGNTEKAFICIKGINMTQSQDSEAIAQMAGSGFEGMLLGETKTHVEEVNASFEGLFPADWDDTDEAILLLFSTDQKAHFSVKNYTSNTFEKDIPFFSLLTPNQKKKLSSLEEYQFDLEYDKSRKMLELDMPKYTSGYFTSTMDFSAKVDATNAVADQDIEKLEIGKINFDTKVNSSDELSKLKFGDGADLGKHTLGGVNADVHFEADLSSLTLDTLSTSSELAILSISESIKLSYELGINDINMNFSTSDNLENQLGTYSIGEISFSIGGDGNGIGAAMTNPIAATQSVDFSFDLKNLEANPATQLSGMLMMFMGLNSEQASTPTIKQLSLKLKADEKGILDLSPNKLSSNFGSIDFLGNINLNTMDLNDVEVNLHDIPPAIFSVAKSRLPQEAVNAIQDDGTNQSLKMNGNIMTGITFE